VFNWTPVVRDHYRLGVPLAGEWRVRLNTDDRGYGGSGAGTSGAVTSDPIPAHGFIQSIAVTLPPLGALWLSPTRSPS